MLYRFVIPRAPKAPEEPAVRRHRHNSWSDGRLVRQRSKATPKQNEHSHPLPVTSILRGQHLIRQGIPHFSRPSREARTTQRRS